MKNINIPEPCSENWNEMTPTQKGAFCQKCALEVNDFTNKSGNEIRAILAQNIGSRVCGRIENVQLAELNTDFEAWKINSGRSYQRAWIFTLFVVFGLTLFSCEEEDVVEKMHRVSQQIIAEQLVEFQESTMTTGEITGNLVGAERIENSIPHVESEEHPMLGEMVFEEREIELEEMVLEEEIVPLIDRWNIAGGMSVSADYRVYLEQTKPVEVDSPEKCTKMSGLIYPNPAQNETTLRLEMPKGDKVEIQLIGLNGQRIQEIHSGRVAEGETEFTIDVSHLEQGMYMVVIIAGDQKESVNFTKI